MGWTGAINAKVRATKSHQSFLQWTHPIHPIGRYSWIGAFCSVWVHFGLFHYCTKLDAKWAEMVELMHKFVAWNRIGSFRNECTQYTQLDPKLLCLVCFIVFGCFCQCFVTTRNLVQNGLNWCNQCTSLCLKVASEFFATNAPSPSHWTLNSCFGAFLSFGWIW